MAQSYLEGDKVGKNQKVRQIQNYTPEQLELQRQGEQRVGPNSYNARLAAGDPALFAEMEAPAFRQFNQLQGQNASRFSGLGGQGALSSRGSSGFQNTAGAQSSNFAQDLQARRQELMRQATLDLHNMSQGLLNNKPYSRWVDEEEPDQGWDWGGIAGATGGAILGSAGGPMGTLQGAATGYSAFKRGGGQSNGNTYNFGGGGNGGNNQNGGFGSWQDLWNKTPWGGG